MKNTIEFYYNIRINELHNRQDKFFFEIGKKFFILEEVENNPNLLNDIYKLNYYLKRRIDIDQIILNRYNSPSTKINDNYYVLIMTKKNLDDKYVVTLPNISFLASINISDINVLERNNWEILWENKIDYYEMQIGQNEKKYPLIRESLDYFIGLSENAISYLVNTKKELKPTYSDRKVISHNSFTKSFFNPLNIIIDHPSRDVAEYIKWSFFKNDYNIFKELDEYFYYNRYSDYGIRVLFARILYPSFYFECYDGIVSGKLEERELNKFINKTNEYEMFLYQIYVYLAKYYSIPEVEWLKKREINPRLQL